MHSVALQGFVQALSRLASHNFVCDQIRKALRIYCIARLKPRHHACLAVLWRILRGDVHQGGIAAIPCVGVNRKGLIITIS